MTKNALSIKEIAETLGLDGDDLAEIFGVHLRTAQRWLAEDFIFEPPYVRLVLSLMSRYKVSKGDLSSLLL